MASRWEGGPQPARGEEGEEGEGEGQRGRRRHLQGRPETEACRLPGGRQDGEGGQLSTSAEWGPCAHTRARGLVGGPLSHRATPSTPTHGLILHPGLAFILPSLCLSAPAGTCLCHPGRARSLPQAMGSPGRGRKGVTHWDRSALPEEGGMLRTVAAGLRTLRHVRSVAGLAVQNQAGLRGGGDPLTLPAKSAGV